LILIKLLSEHAELSSDCFSIILIIDFNVIILIGVTWIESYNGSGFHKFSIDNLLEHLLSFIIELLGLLSHSLVFEDLWVSSIGVLASDLPSLEEGVPIDVRNQGGNVVVHINLFAQEFWLNNIKTCPVDFHGLGLGFGK